jgi:hypothetical protein
MIFMIALGAFVYELLTQGDYGLPFLLMGAIGCVYLLMLGEQHLTGQQHYHPLLPRPARGRTITPSSMPLPKFAGSQAAVSWPQQSAEFFERRKNRGHNNWPQQKERRRDMLMAAASAK